MSKIFSKKCYELLKKIPKGRVTTYKEIALALNSKAYRAVGSAMNKNPYSLIVPCHRVVNANGFVGGYAYGQKKKVVLLKKEGVEINEKGFIDLKKFLWKPITKNKKTD